MVILSYVILTRNRCRTLLRTIDELLRRTVQPDEPWEIIVVDNASTDGTAEALARQYPRVRVIKRDANEGSVARNAGIEAAAGRYVMLLDDDSAPEGQTVRRAIGHLEQTPDCGLVGGRVVLPDGAEDAAALPIVLPACAWCARREAIIEVGGFCKVFFRQAEEYDLIFRMLASGWRVDRFEDLIWRHEKVRTSRDPALILKMDLRNNLILVDRYLPEPLAEVYREDWRERYTALARAAGCEQIIAPAIEEAMHERAPARPLPDDVLEQIFGFQQQAQTIGDWARANGARRIAIAGLTKNVYATVRGCRLNGLEIISVAEDHPAFAGSTYRGHAVRPLQEVAAEKPDGIVLAEINPARVARAHAHVREVFAGPILRLWQPRFLRDKELQVAAGEPAPIHAS